MFVCVCVCCFFFFFLQKVDNRDHLLAIEKVIQARWDDHKSFEKDAPEDLNTPKFMLTFPFPYMVLYISTTSIYMYRMYIHNYINIGIHQLICTRTHKSTIYFPTAASFFIFFFFAFWFSYIDNMFLILD